jgi:hypothetical protein
MTPENLAELLEHACSTPEYLDLCRALTLYERGDREDMRRMQQIGESLVLAIESGLREMVKNKL